MTLVIKKNQLDEFYTRWRAKSDDYNSDELSDYFDKFFTLFVIYNRIYNVVVSILNEQGQLDVLRQQGKIDKRKKEPDDNKAATICVAHFLRDDLPAIVADNQNRIDEFKKIIRERLFNIDLKYGQPQRQKDLDLLTGLESNNNLTIVESLLKILYKIRCNVFHAEKGYNDEQRIILEPCNNCLQDLVEKLILKVRAS
jgi:hypothetical protein